ncbi:MAG: SDR family NAD(P)-dependent oxidoreductase [Proteobacteria bacterium]|nr:SDR family NAD(P)-dependent oxidoreductase [Pseudomonadota bacterium]
MTDHILVTGADGFIGSHLVEALVRAGRKVRALSLYNSFDQRGWLDHLPAEMQASFETVAGDIRDRTCVREAMRGCSRVMHLAALIAIPFSYRAPELYVDVNIGGTLNVLEAARDLGVTRLVQTSTSEVYGTAQTVPIDETHPLVGQSPYAASKIGADQMALAYHRSFGLPVAIARPFNTYGPRQSARAVIPAVVVQIAAGRSRIELGAVHPTRDFNFVRDTVDGMIAVLDCDAAVGEVCNIGSGHEISVGDVAALIAETMGRKVEIVLAAERLRPAASEVERLVCDPGKLGRLSGWKPRLSGRAGLRSGIAETAAWFADPANRALYRAGSYVV